MNLKKEEEVKRALNIGTRTSTYLVLIRLSAHNSIALITHSHGHLKKKIRKIPTDVNINFIYQIEQ